MTERAEHSTPERTEAYWALERQTLFAQLRSGPTGLTDREARRRLASSPLASELFHDRHNWLLLIGREFCGLLGLDMQKLPEGAGARIHARAVGGPFAEKPS